MRGLDGRASGQLYLDGWGLTYNLFREHEGIGGRTPAEKAKLDVPFKTWADVVESRRPRVRVKTEAERSARAEKLKAGKA